MIWLDIRGKCWLFVAFLSSGANKRGGMCVTPNLSHEAQCWDFVEKKELLGFCRNFMRGLLLNRV